MIHTLLSLIVVLSTILPARVGNPYTLTEPGLIKIYWADPQEPYPWAFRGVVRLREIGTYQIWEVELNQVEIIQRPDGKFDVLFSGRFCKPGLYQITEAYISFGPTTIEAYLLGVVYRPFCNHVRLPMITK